MLGDSGSLPCLICSEGYIISNVETKQPVLENPVPGHFKNSKSQPGRRWCLPLIPTPRKQTQADLLLVFKANLVYNS